MSYQLEQPVLKPEIQKFVQTADSDAWRKLNQDQRYQILHALQRFGVLSDTGFISLNWLLEAKALDLVSEKYLKEKINGIRKAVQEKLNAILPVIPDLDLPKRDVKPELARPEERMLDINEMEERFKKFGINLFKTRLKWGGFYIRNKYWKPGEPKSLPIPSISEYSMQQFESALETRQIDTIAFDDCRLGEGQALHHLTDLNNPYLIKVLDQSRQASPKKLRELLLINEPLPQGTHTTKRDKKFLRKAKEDTERLVIKQINQEQTLRGRTQKPIQLIGFSISGAEHYDIPTTAEKFRQPGWTAMSIGTINRILAFLTAKDPEAARAFLSVNSEAHFTNNFTAEGKPIGFEICEIPQGNTIIATPKPRRNIFATNNQSPFIPVLVGR
jgi:hypothetical protein